MSFNVTRCSFSPPVTTTILKVEPGSAVSEITRLRSASMGEWPGWLGSKFGRVAMARISPVRGRTMMQEALMGECFCTPTANSLSTMACSPASRVKTTFNPSRGATSSVAVRNQFALALVHFRSSPARDAAEIRC